MVAMTVPRATTVPGLPEPSNPDMLLPPSVAKHPLAAALVTIILSVCSTIGGVYALQPAQVDYSDQIEGMAKRLDKLEVGLQFRETRAADRLADIEKDLANIRTYHQTQAAADQNLYRWQDRITGRVDRLEDAK